MVAPQSIIVAILASNFRFGNAGIDDNRKPCSTNESDHHDTEILDFSQSDNKSGYVCPLETTWGTSDRKVDFMFGQKMCLSLCCPFGEARHEGSCIKDNATYGRIKIDMETKNNERVLSWQNFHLITNDPCEFEWMVPSVLEDFYLLGNRSIYTTDVNENSVNWDYDHYCVFRNSQSVVYMAKVCHPLLQKGWWEIVCAIIVVLVMLAIFIAYTVVPELKNLHGIIFRSYVATYVATGLCILGVEFTTEVRTEAHWYIFFESAARCCGFSCLLWLNVMSFNIWRSFRNVRSIDCNTSKREKKKFIWYATYAWIFPVVVIPSSIATMYHVTYFHDETIGKFAASSIGYTIKIWGSAIVITIIYSSNAFLYISTALSIRQYKKDTAHLARGMNKHHEIAEQWFNLHVKLFFIMGGHIIAWVIWLLWLTSISTYLLATIEVLQAIIIFVIFVWKDNIKQSFCEQFRATMKTKISSHV